MSDITVIIPIHELKNDEDINLFEKSIKSIKQSKVKPKYVNLVIKKDEDLLNKVKSIDYGEIHDIINIIENDGDTSFQNQLMVGVNNCKTEWFSLLEYDDEYSAIWFKNVIEYIKSYPDVDMFLPIIVDIQKLDENNIGFMGFTNEVVWANSFSTELGSLDNDALLSYPNINIDGMVMKKDKFLELGGIKKNIKLTFIYEFLLRATFKSTKIMVIPKFGYQHLNNRENSLFSIYKGSMDPIEARWWLDKAKKEYYFDEDREITYHDEVK